MRSARKKEKGKGRKNEKAYFFSREGKVRHCLLFLDKKRGAFYYLGDGGKGTG